MVDRPSPLRALGAAVALATTASVVPIVAGAAPAAAAPALPAYDAPLVITIDSLTPGEVPESGPVVVSGTVANRDVVTWGAISLYPFINAGDCAGCPPPMTTTAELAEAAETDPTALVGNRINEASDSIEELAPGEVESYRIRVPRSLLGVTEAGIYWFGVHASGESETSPRDGLADGRARTFLPYLPQGRNGIDDTIDTAVVVSLRHRISHSEAGAIARPEEWRSAFGEAGDLGGPLRFGAAAGPRPLTWLIDPAVADVARRLASGNPPRDIGPRSDEEPEETESEDGEEPTGTPTDGEEPEPEPPRPDPVAEAADAWLSSLELRLRGEDVLALPYGDLDVSAAAGAPPDLYPVARERVGDAIAEWGTETVPTVASPGGYLDPTAFDSIDDESVWLLTDRMFADRDAFPEGPPAVGVYGDHPIAVTSYGAASGGPGPDPRLAPVAFRQRVLSEAAARLLSSDEQRPLIVVVPKHVDAEGAAEFWGGLSASWLNLTTVSDAIAREQRPVDPESLEYPEDLAGAELEQSVLLDAGELIDRGVTLQNMLTRSEVVAGEVRDEALAGASYNFRSSPRIATRNLTRSREWIDRRLAGVRIDAPPGVTLSSPEGSFAATVTNRLNRTVTVRIAGTSSSQGVTIDTGDPIVLSAKSRTTVFLDARTTSQGVHNVTLSVTDIDGTPLGSADQVPIRSGQVSEVIWVIIGVGVGILFLAIALRLVRRVRSTRGAA